MKIPSQVELELLIAVCTRLLDLIRVSLSVHHIALASIHAAAAIAAPKASSHS
jgi:hypothetical protein